MGGFSAAEDSIVDFEKGSLAVSESRYNSTWMIPGAIGEEIKHNEPDIMKNEQAWVGAPGEMERVLINHLAVNAFCCGHPVYHDFVRPSQKDTGGECGFCEACMYQRDETTFGLG